MEMVYSYRELVKKHGVKKGAELYKQAKEELKNAAEKSITTVKDKRGKTIGYATMVGVEGSEEIEEKPLEQIPEKDARENLKHRSDEVRKTVSTEGWQEYIEPRIEACINIYESVYDDADDIKSYEEWRINKGIKKELRAILEDIDRWTNERKELMEEEGK